MKRVTIIGSTGSVGVNTLKVIDGLPDRFEVVGLAARGSVAELARQTARYRPLRVALADAAMADAFRSACHDAGTPEPDLVLGPEGLREIGGMPESDIVVSAAVGAAGLEPTYAALRAGKRVALANKEAMVIAGELLRATAGRHGGSILPVDSEHNAIDQCLRAGRHDEVRRLILTASGGPFLDRPARDLDTVSPAEALDHPTWKMGPRITIDSATLMNKGFEVIEARWLFDVPSSAIDIIVHPQSIVHSMVEFVDGSIVAQMGVTDMRLPIQYALTWPERQDSPLPGLDWTRIPRLEFRPPDREKFPALDLAYRALEMGGTAPAVLNAADEIAVGAFLNGEIAFTAIPRIVAAVMDAHQTTPTDSIQTVLDADLWGREMARQVATRYQVSAGPVPSTGER
jgi:1-deoxy-D-xylulose-5-phosphate reductoisomerase